MTMKNAVTISAAVLLFATFVCQATADTYEPQWKPGADSPFEVGTQLRPWTIRDEGMDTILDNCQSMAGVNNIYLIVIMHHEHRPFQAKKFPHNPVRETFMAEDSTVAWSPDMMRYGKIKPKLSEYDWIRETDWLKLTIDACRERGLGVGAEISHYPMPKSMLTKDSEWIQRNVRGDPVNKPRFCCHHPDVRHYVLALFGDLAANYDLDYIQTCQYLGGECFCEHCIRAAKDLGFDMAAAIPVLQKDKDAEPYREQYRKFRRKANTRFFRDIAETIRKENPKCSLRLNDVYSWGGHDPYAKGYDFKAISPHLGSMVNQDHQEQKGRPDEDFAHRKAWLTYNRDCLGPDTPLLSGIAARMQATPELVRRGIKVAVQHPAKINGLALKHYDGASFSLLRAFKQGMIEAGVQGLTPTLGKEAEDMELEGYAPFDEELAEEWGVETTGTGSASHLFNLPSGVYDVRITYFDDPVGQSDVKLVIAGTEKASFKMDEDCDCWRRRMFRDVEINKGDRITLTGRVDQEDLARLDFVEYIPR